MRKRLLNLCLTALLSVVATAAWALSDVDGVYQIGTAAELEEIALSLPLSRELRPAWDVRTLERSGIRIIRINK